MLKVSIRSAAPVLVIILWAGLASTDASAQERSGSIKFGPGFFTLLGEDDYKPLPNFAAAGSMRMTFGSMLIQPEILVSTRGGRTRQDVQTIAGQALVRIDQGITYLDLPILIGLSMRGALTPALYAGPYGGVRVDARWRLMFEDPRGGQLAEALPQARRWDAGLTAGGSIEIQTNFYRVLLEARGLYGLAPVFREDPSMRHAGAMLLIGIVF